MTYSMKKILRNIAFIFGIFFFIALIGHSFKVSHNTSSESNSTSGEEQFVVPNEGETTPPLDTPKPQPAEEEKSSSSKVEVPLNEVLPHIVISPSILQKLIQQLKQAPSLPKERASSKVVLPPSTPQPQQGTRVPFSPGSKTSLELSPLFPPPLTSTPLTYEELLQELWDDIKYYVTGIEEVEAFSYYTGRYYYLDADIENGFITRIYFPNGGYLNFYAEIQEDGSAWDLDYRGNMWDFQIDLNSPLIRQAIHRWLASR